MSGHGVEGDDMDRIVDARGLACPQPVIRTRQAMQEGDQVVALVDNEAALSNVSRMAEKAGWRVDVSRQGDDYRIALAKGEGVQPKPLPLGRAEPSSDPLVLVVSADKMGRGEAELGQILIRGFFHALGEVEPQPQTMILFNTGVRLACEGSPVLEDLSALAAAGVEILVCGTCLNYFQLKERLAAGRVSNMYEIAETMLRAGKLVHL